jgi:hypothetical protein
VFVSFFLSVQTTFCVCEDGIKLMNALQNEII